MQKVWKHGLKLHVIICDAAVTEITFVNNFVSKNITEFSLDSPQISVIRISHLAS